MNKVIEYFANKNMGEKVTVFDESSATVELAANAIGCKPQEIAKSITFSLPDKSILIVCAGDAKIDNAKFKAEFGVKAKMLTYIEVLEKIGHPVGGVCPFLVNDSVDIYLDSSLKRFSVVWAACGSSNSVVELTLDQLENYSKAIKYIDVCKNWMPN